MPPIAPRPSRRSLLLTGALGAPLLLSGCVDRGGAAEGEPEETAEPPPVVTVAFDDLTTDPELVAPSPVLRAHWGTSAGQDRPSAMLVQREIDSVTDLWVLTADDPDHAVVPIDPATTDLAVDGHGSVVQVLASRADGASCRTTRWASTDLTTWTETDLGTSLERPPSVLGGGVAVSAQLEGTLLVWTLAEDGAVAALTPVEVPDGQEWMPQTVARHEDTIVLALAVRDGQGISRPAVLRSEDAGGAWAEPEVLLETGVRGDALSVLALAGGVLVLGEYEAGVAWHDEFTQTRPTAWWVTAGQDPTREEIPLPQFGIDGWQNELRGSLSATTPVDYVRISSGSAVVDRADGGVHLGVHWGDEVRDAHRRAEGDWTVSGSDGYAPGAVIGALVAPEGRIVLTAERAHVLSVGAEEYRRGLVYSPVREYSGEQGVDSQDVLGVLRWEMRDSERDSQLARTDDEYSAVSVRVVEDRLELGEDLPEDATTWELPRLRRPLEDVGLVLGAVDGDSTNSLGAQVRIDGEWGAVEGLDVHGFDTIGQVTVLDGTLYFPVTVRDRSGPTAGPNTPQVHTSSDGVVWSVLGAADPSTWEAPELAEGMRMAAVTTLGGAPLGLGAAVDADGIRRAATASLEGDAWIPRIVPDLPPDTMLLGVEDVNGELLVEAEREGWRILLRLLEDGTVEEVYAATHDQHRGPQIELGDGTLLAAGWVRRPGEACGACLWGSADAGTTWTPTVLPGHEGRYPDLTLRREGDGAVVIAAHPDAPRGLRLAEVSVG